MIAASGAGIPEADEEFDGSEHSPALNHILIPLTAPRREKPVGRERATVKMGAGGDRRARDQALARNSDNSCGPFSLLIGLMA